MKTKLILAILFLTLFAPFLTDAFVNIGPPCGEVINGKQECPYCPSDLGFNPKTNTGVHLKWDLAGFSTNTNYPIFCSLTCTNPENNYGCRQTSYRFVDSEGVASNNPNDNKLLPGKEDVYVNEPVAGDIYKASCFQNVSSSFINKESPQMKVVGCGGKCEVPFKTITASLNASHRTIITEADFRNWYQVASNDYVNWPTNNQNGGLGSGDQNDIKKYIEQEQAQITFSNQSASSLTNPASIIPILIERLNKFTPTRLSYVFEEDKTLSGHAVVALSISLLTIEDFNNLELGRRFTIDVYDPGSSKGFDQIVCSLGSGAGTMANQKFLFCSSPTYPDQDIVLMAGDHNGSYIDCPELTRVRPKPTEWIKSNISSIKNWTNDQNNKTKDGVCWGISNFIVKVACFGDFSGVDYHSNDGKIIGKDCDINHYPKGGATSWFQQDTLFASLMSIPILNQIKTGLF